MTRPRTPPHLTPIPLASWERDGVAAALTKAGLPAEDVRVNGPLFWRFELPDLTPAGFGGLEIHGDHALLRSVVTLPPLRRRGIARAMVRTLEAEARIAGCRTIWVITSSAAPIFGRLGYDTCDPAAVPQPIRQTQEFAALSAASATVMTKVLA